MSRERKTIRVELDLPEEFYEGAYSEEPYERQHHVPQLEELSPGVELFSNREGFILRSWDGPRLKAEDEQPVEVASLAAGRSVLDVLGNRISMDGRTLVLEPAPELARCAIPGPDLSDDGLWLPEAARLASTQATDVGRGEVSAGLVLRFGRPASLEVIRSGRAPDREIPSRWWKALTAEQRSEIGRNSASATELLGLRVDDLLADAEPESSGWRGELLDACRTRDDLCSTARVLRTFAPASVPALSEVDASLRRLFFSLYQEIPARDPLLLLVASEGAGWWSRPGALSRQSRSRSARPESPVDEE